MLCLHGQTLGTETLGATADDLGISSSHITFNQQKESDRLSGLGFLQRTGIQYHWENQGYANFDAFLATLRQSKRKSIRQVSLQLLSGSLKQVSFDLLRFLGWERYAVYLYTAEGCVRFGFCAQERKAIAKSGLTVTRRGGHDLKPSHWDRFYEFYRDTTDRKWGSAYLTRDFFQEMGFVLGDHVLLVVAQEGGPDSPLVAGALNLIGSDAIYGRNWGCAWGTNTKHLHFEMCYYQVNTTSPCEAAY